MKRNSVELGRPLFSAKEIAIKNILEERDKQVQVMDYDLSGGFDFPKEWNEDLGGGWLVIGNGRDMPRMDVVGKDSNGGFRIGITGSEQPNDVCFSIRARSSQVEKTINMKGNEGTLVLVALDNEFGEDPVVWASQIRTGEKSEATLVRMVSDHPEMSARKLVVFSLEQHLPGQTMVTKIGSGNLTLKSVLPDEIGNFKNAEDMAGELGVDGGRLLRNVMGDELEIEGLAINRIEPVVQIPSRNTTKISGVVEPFGYERRMKKEKTLGELGKAVEQEFGVKVDINIEKGEIVFVGDDRVVTNLLKKGMRSRGGFPYIGYTPPNSRNWWNYRIRTTRGESVARVNKVYDGSISQSRLEIEVPDAGKREETVQVWRELMKNALVVEAR